MFTCYKIYNYFEFQLFTYDFISMAHNVTLIKNTLPPVPVQINVCISLPMNESPTKNNRSL